MRRSRRVNNQERWRRFSKSELVSEIMNSPSTAIPRITTITDWPSQTLIVQSKGIAKPQLLFFNVLRLIPRYSLSEKGIIPS